MVYICEADIESLLVDQLQALGYTRTTDARIGPDGSAPEREAYSDVLLLGRLRTAIDRLNPQIPAQARHDALMQVVASKSPSLTANAERFMPWRTTDGRGIAPKTAPELAVLIEGVCERRRFLDLLQSFIVFADTGSGLVKIVAGYHQFHAVQLAVASTVRAIAQVDPGIGEDPETYGPRGVRDYRRGDRRVGVIWDTQGSGKRLLMVQKFAPAAGETSIRR